MPANFNPDSDIPSLAGKVILITGGTSGLGAGTVAELAKHNPAQIFFTGRNKSSADGLIASVNKANPGVEVSFIRSDISSLASVQKCAKQFKSQASRLDILILNAGIMAVDPAVSVDGYETQFATNHLGHALLVESLLPELRGAAADGGDARIINMTSVAHAQAPSKVGIEFSTLKTPQDSLGGLIPGGRWARYGQSKLAQLLYSQQLARKHPEITTVAIHPGIIFTGLFTGLSFATKLPVLLMSIGNSTPVEEGHFNQCWAATCAKSRLVNGGYYEPVGLVGKMKWKGDETTVGQQLWEWTQKEIGQYVQ